ncbi:hypothetical protein TREMEDRAFT_34827 [Tremella mesenterica DSM 1558]|uniref:uncharacterized protein n=1 Tax=Tremella mesenterica (strain ATCC 24925 / CBS 8224 / DSM 1558 / NBRC 9311 / NRRL Y-6157 / RJB 2259-6 / UBC 559-6) TaxID=578456 RepID=UPI00032D3994|nr:uncharacterized protein TREMEDRAFT_34827 [Tremella mesenterica DSM 1558]EIW66576.1 hypothetical protein TREMEDRAFT_34827 [Tremella mesenterica DSM 1558]
MAALNRLSQRIRENFHETTRDISLLAGGAGSSTAVYFDASDDKISEISKLLDSRQERERLEGMKRIIAGMSKGRDMEPFFAQVVKNVVAPSIEIRKLVYIYLLRFASTNSDLLLLSVNTFQKDLSDPSPLIRSMSLRVLTSIRVPVIQGIVMLGLKKLVTDRNPWVRKTVAGGLAKVYEMDHSSLPQLIALLQTLLSSPSPLTLGASLTAFSEMCPDRLDLLHPYYRHICRLVVDADEWGQVVALNVLTRYARVMLEKPDMAGAVRPSTKLPKEKMMGDEEEDDDEFEGLDVDLAMFLDCIRPLFQSRNAAVVLATAMAYYHLAPAGHDVIGQELIVLPLLRLASTNLSIVGGEEIASLTWETLAIIVEERPWLFSLHQTCFYLHESDTSMVKSAKLRAMHYTLTSNENISSQAVQAIGHCVRTQPEVSSMSLSILMRLLKSRRDSLVAQSVIVLKSVILAQTSISDPQLLVGRLVKQLDGITNPAARASVFWLAGQYSASDVSPSMGLGWEGMTSWAPDVLRKGIKGFILESSIAKLQILTLATKLLVLSPSTPQLTSMSQYLFQLARFDKDYDVRDRSRFLYSLLKGVFVHSSPSLTESDEETTGVVLRREQVKVVVLGQRTVKVEINKDQSGEYDVGSLSSLAKKKLVGYENIPDWTDEPTDSSLRDSEVEKPIMSIPSLSPSPSPIPMLNNSTSSTQKSILTPVESPAPGSLNQKNEFRDLDAFLNSETESEEETEEET